MSKSVLLTGGSGFIGSHLHSSLASYEVTNLDLREPRFPVKSSWRRGDIRLKADVERSIEVSEPDVIISLAAQHKDFGLSENDYFATNYVGTQVLCDAAAKYGVTKIIFISSVAVYGDSNYPSTETSDTLAAHPYGRSKLAGEMVLHKWAAADRRRSVVILRPTVVYGERNVANMFRLINQIKSRKFANVGKGSNIKSIAYVRNLVSAISFLQSQMVSGVHIYNYADTPHLTSRQISDLIADSLAVPRARVVPSWLASLAAVPFDIAIKFSGKDLPVSSHRIKKLQTQTHHNATRILKAGFTPEFTNLQGIERMVQWRESEYTPEQFYYDV